VCVWGWEYVYVCVYAFTCNTPLYAAYEQAYFIAHIHTHTHMHTHTHIHTHIHTHLHAVYEHAFFFVH
jgi:hypothetical protein